MNSTEIRLNGKTVSNLEAARALAEVGGQVVKIGKPGSACVTVSARCDKWGDGEISAPEMTWPSASDVPAAEARLLAEAIALGAEVAELAEMLAAEQG